MRNIVLTIMALILSATAFAQHTATTDTTTFQGYYYNKEYNVYIRMNAYRSNIKVPGQEIYGELPGFFGDNQDGRKWLFTSVEVTDPTTATLQVINDYGSEDLEATFTRQPDNTFQLKQGAGSTMKLARNRKWVKLPKTMVFIKK
ncbi:MAG: hypothetical protein I3J02_11290 [Prevotella sp.]|nr:hypothetical protein [Prevotella sp.]